jgi:capsular polysaccharide export protein
VNVAYLDPPYSRYFHALASRLAVDGSGRPLALLSSPAYRAYAGDHDAMVWEPGRVKAAPPLPADLSHAFWGQRQDDTLRAVFWHAVAWFRERFIDARTDLCLVFSDARPFSAAAQVAARELGVVCLYFERGAFRYSTASLSTLGLNSRFSLVRARRFDGLVGLPAHERLQRRETEVWLRLRFARFIASNAVACLLRPDRRRLQHKRYAFAPYLRLAWSQWAREHHIGHAEGVHAAAGRTVVIVPLQLETDSQLVLHSPFASNQEFLDFVAERVIERVPDALVLVKRHPMDASRYRLPAGARWVGGNLARFYDADPVVVCVNSTVGFEAAVRGVRVLCMASSFYSEAAHVRLTTVEAFDTRFDDLLASRPDHEAGRALKTEILGCYQAPGDVWAFTDEDIERTAGIVGQHFATARAHLPASNVRPAAAAITARESDPATA